MFLILPKCQWVLRGGEGRAESQRQRGSTNQGLGVAVFSGQQRNVLVVCCVPSLEAVVI